MIAVIIFVSRGGMGWGDASLMAGAGAALGWQLSAWGLYSGFMIGGVIALGLHPVPQGQAKRTPYRSAVPGRRRDRLDADRTWFYSFLGMSVGWPWGLEGEGQEGGDHLQWFQ